MVAFINYITSNWRILDRVPECINIKLGLMLGWAFCFVLSVAMCRILRKKGSIKRIGIIALLVTSVVCLICIEKDKESYIEKKTEDVRFHKLFEDYEEHNRENSGEIFYPYMY